jgi:hypothetical protein
MNKSRVGSISIVFSLHMTFTSKRAQAKKRSPVLSDDDIATPANALRAILSSEVSLLLSSSSSLSVVELIFSSHDCVDFPYGGDTARVCQLFAKSDPKAVRTLVLSIGAMTISMWLLYVMPWYMLPVGWLMAAVSALGVRRKATKLL